jgi:hypothetical protein
VVDVVGLFAYDPAFMGGVYIAAASPPPATLWAVVSDDGTLVRGSHAVSALFDPSTLTYRIIFDRNVRNYACVATIATPFVIGPGEIAAQNISDNGVRVVLTRIQQVFHLVEHC